MHAAPYGVLPYGQPYLSTLCVDHRKPAVYRSETSEGGWAAGGAWGGAVGGLPLPVDWPVLDWRFRRGIHVTADRLGECRFFFLGMFVLPGRVPRGIAVEILPASLFGPCHVGSSAGFANFPDQAEIGNRSGGRRDGIDSRHVEP